MPELSDLRERLQIERAELTDQIERHERRLVSQRAMRVRRETLADTEVALFVAQARRHRLDQTLRLLNE